MTDTKDLHARMEALERKIAEARTELESLDDEARRGLGDWLEQAGEELDGHRRAAANRST